MLRMYIGWSVVSNTVVYSYQKSEAVSQYLNSRRNKRYFSYRTYDARKQTFYNFDEKFAISRSSEE